jgi:DNA-binding TFAR19-related protein (PDSD5 family)
LENNEIKMTDKENNSEEHELEKLRLQKMRALMEAKKQQEAAKERVTSIFEKVDYVLKLVLDPSAYSHLMTLKSTEPPVYQAIFNELITEEVIQKIDYLIAIIQQRGGVQKRIPLDAIIYLERQIKGVKSKIQVKRGDGEMMDLGSYLTK